MDDTHQSDKNQKMVLKKHRKMVGYLCADCFCML